MSILNSQSEWSPAGAEHCVLHFRRGAVQGADDLWSKLKSIQLPNWLLPHNSAPGMNSMAEIANMQRIRQRSAHTDDGGRLLWEAQ
jgi:hypothetical protein